MVATVIFADRVFRRAKIAHTYQVKKARGGIMRSDGRSASHSTGSRRQGVAAKQGTGSGRKNHGVYGGDVTTTMKSVNKRKGAGTLCYVSLAFTLLSLLCNRILFCVNKH